MSLYPASAFAPSFALILKFVLPWLKKLAQISNGSRFYRFQIFFAPIIIVISQFHLFMDNFLCRFYDFNHFMWNNFRLAVRAAVAHFQRFFAPFSRTLRRFQLFSLFLSPINHLSYFAPAGSTNLAWGLRLPGIRNEWHEPGARTWLRHRWVHTAVGLMFVNAYSTTVSVYSCLCVLFSLCFSVRTAVYACIYLF